MKCYVYERMERVVYVVGVTGSSAAEAFADVLYGEHALIFHGDSKNKPFARTDSKNVMYMEKVGTMRPSRDVKPLIRKAMNRAELLNIEHAETNLEVDQ